MVVTLTMPVAPVLTTALMDVAEVMVNEAAGTPPKLTAEVPFRLVPVIVTLVPAFPEAGEKDVIVGPI